MKKDLYLSLDIDDSIQDIDSLKREILALNEEEGVPEIEGVEEESPALGIVEALIISLAAKFIFEYII